MADNSSTDNAEQQFWFNTKTGQVEQGKQSSWDNRMGPYATREEAAGALERARANTAAWDAEDADWEQS